MNSRCFMTTLNIDWLHISLRAKLDRLIVVSIARKTSSTLAFFDFSGLLVLSNCCARATLFGQYHLFMAMMILILPACFYSSATQFSEQHANLSSILILVHINDDTDSGWDLVEKGKCAGSYSGPSSSPSRRSPTSSSSSPCSSSSTPSLACRSTMSLLS